MSFQCLTFSLWEVTRFLIHNYQFSRIQQVSSLHYACNKCSVNLNHGAPYGFCLHTLSIQSCYNEQFCSMKFGNVNLWRFRQRWKDLCSLSLLSSSLWDFIKRRPSVDFINPVPTSFTTMTIKLLSSFADSPNWVTVASLWCWLSVVLSVSPTSPLVLQGVHTPLCELSSFKMKSCRQLFTERFLPSSPPCSTSLHKTWKWP